MLSSGHFLLTTYPWARAHRQVLRQAMSRGMWYGMWAVPAIGAAWLVLCAVAPRVGMVFGDLTPAYIGGLCVVAFLPLMRVRNAKLRGAFSASAFRAGNWTVSIADDGLHHDSENVRQVLAWHCVTEVRDGPDGLLVMLGPVVFLPVPAAAFENEAGFAAFRAALQARIAEKGAV